MTWDLSQVLRHRQFRENVDPIYIYIYIYIYIETQFLRLLTTLLFVPWLPIETMSLSRCLNGFLSQSQNTLDFLSVISAARRTVLKGQCSNNTTKDCNERSPSQMLFCLSGSQWLEERRKQESMSQTETDTIHNP